MLTDALPRSLGNGSPVRKYKTVSHLRNILLVVHPIYKIGDYVRISILRYPIHKRL
jgi:hypothetical protein